MSSTFRLFDDYVDKTIVHSESSSIRASKSPAAWPSEASAIRTDPSFFGIYGTCMRRAFLRMIGWPQHVETEPEGPWKWYLGRMIEDKLTELCTLASADIDGVPQSLYVANGIKYWIRDLYLAIEMDVIVRDPKTNIAYILECKSFDGYFAISKIERERKPKDENLIQIAIYLFAMQNGKKLKEVIKESLSDRVKLDALGREHRNRAEANLDVLDQLSDGPVRAKLVYISRGECNRTEFDVGIYKDADGFHYLLVDGMPYKAFTVESIFERFKTLQKYWFMARREAAAVLAEQGIHVLATMQLLLSPGDEAPDQTLDRGLTKEEQAQEAAYYRKLEEAVRALPDSFFPPPEYSWSYSEARIHELGKAKEIGKTKYAEYNAGKIDRIGDWQCAYCPFAQTGCIARQRPDLAYQIYDLAALSDDVEVEIGA